MATQQKYTGSLEALLDGTIPDLGTATVNIALLEGAYTPDLDAHNTFTDVSADEVPGASEGYTSGGETITGVTVDRGVGEVTVTADNVNWPDSTIEADYAVIYEDSSDRLLTLITFDTTQESLNGDFSVNFTEGSIFTVSPS